MFDEHLLNPSTRAKLATFLNSPTHALMLVGATGSGKRFIANQLASILLGITPDKLAQHPYYLEVTRLEDKKDISIESVRGATKLLALKIPGSRQIRRVVVVPDAHYMNAQAQNALLKSLEEPPADTVFILTSDSTSELLPTITSRVQKIVVHSAPLDLAKDYYSSSFSATEVKTAWLLSDGLVGALSGILDKSDQATQTAIDQAKSIFRQNIYQRLVTFERLGKDKEQLATVLAAMARIAKVLYRQSVATNRGTQLKKLLVTAKLISAAQNDLAASVSPKLVSLKLILNLPL